MIPHTTSTRNSRFEIKLDTEYLQEGAFDVQNVVTISTTKLVRKLGKLTTSQLEQIEQALKNWLGLK